MDKRVEKKKLDLNSRYHALTQGLQWTTSYQPLEKVFPYARYEGIRVHDWSQWQDPLKMTLDVWWRQQSDKERRVYAVLDAFAQNNGQIGISDARYINAVKLLLQAFAPLKYVLHRALTHSARNLPDNALRTATQLQATQMLRHAQNFMHSASIYNKYFNGMHETPRWHEQAWYLAPVKSFAEDAASAGPFELLVAISFGFESLLSDTLYVPFMSAAAHNGDLSMAPAGFSSQSDAARHKQIGITAVKFLLEQDPANISTVQRWVDKWFWRSFRLMPMVAMLQDYMVSKRVGSWRESWDTYVEAPVEALFAELAQYGLKKPAGWNAACAAKDHLSHQAWNAFYGYGHALAFHTWVPGNDELEWLDRKYPNSFDRWYRPRLAHYAQLEAAGQRFHNHTLPMQCQVCQQPMMFTEPVDGRWIAYRKTQHEDENFHFCSDQCQTIFGNEPEKYLQANLPSHAILKSLRGAPIEDALQASIAELGVVIGRDSGEFSGSEDDAHFTEWGGGQDMKEAQL